MFFSEDYEKSPVSLQKLLMSISCFSGGNTFSDRMTHMGAFCPKSQQIFWAIGEVLESVLWDLIVPQCSVLFVLGIAAMYFLCYMSE